MERTDLEQWKAREVSRLLALVETERRYYQEIVATLPVALVILSADRGISSANRAFRQTLGLKTKDLRGKTIEQILPSDRLIEKIREAHTSEAPHTAFSLEQSGRRFTLDIVPIRNEDDETEIETLIMLQAAEETKIAPAPVTDVDIPAIVWEADSGTLQFRSVYGDFAPLLGYTADHWTQTPTFFEQRIHPEDRASTLRFYQQAVARGSGDASAEFRGLTVSGGAVWMRETVRVSARALKGVLTSIERRKQLEDQLLRAGRVNAVQGVASRLAHDLNNPLMIVTGYAEEMRNSLSDDDPMRGDVEQILTATNRISDITAQLLDYTRRHAHPPSAVNVTAELARMKEPIAHAAGEGCEVQIAPSSAVWALADETQLEEVVLALISRDREGAKRLFHLSIGCETDIIAEQVPGTTLPPGSYARLTIHHGGQGLDAADGASVFEEFLSKQSDKTAGAALARAYGIVRGWGGDIAFFNEPARGSTFLVYLPHADAEPEAAPVAEPRVAAAPAEIVRETILVVEDEPGIRALVRKILRREHFNVLEAGSAEEATAIAASTSGRIDLLLTDVMLPAASGRDLAEWIRETRHDLKVLYISGYTDNDAVRTGAIPAGSKFLQKPFTLGALVAKVKEALGS